MDDTDDSCRQRFAHDSGCSGEWKEANVLSTGKDSSSLSEI